MTATFFFSTLSTYFLSRTIRSLLMAHSLETGMNTVLTENEGAVQLDSDAHLDKMIWHADYSEQGLYNLTCNHPNHYWSIESVQ